MNKTKRNINFWSVILSAIFTFLFGNFVITCSYFDNIFPLSVISLMSAFSIVCVLFSAYYAFVIDRILAKKDIPGIGETWGEK